MNTPLRRPPRHRPHFTPASATTPSCGRWQDVLTALYVLSLALISAADQAGPERWAVSNISLYVPQWLWAIPGLGLLLGARKAKIRALTLTLCLFWVGWFLMGFSCRWPIRAPQEGAHLRVMTYNVDQDLNNPAALQQIEDAHPDLLLVQEAQAPLLAELVALHDWHVTGPIHGCLIISRLPLLDVQVRQLRPAPLWRQYLRCRVEVSGREVTVYDLHLDTARWGLDAIRRDGLSGLSAFDEDTRVRIQQARGVAADLSQETGPVIVAGDLNAPIDSLVCRQLTGQGLRDAFSDAGWGYGYTYGHKLRVGHSYARIDHILTSPDWQALDCRVGGPEGSDHRPVIADLILPKHAAATARFGGGTARPLDSRHFIPRERVTQDQMRRKEPWIFGAPLRFSTGGNG